MNLLIPNLPQQISFSKSLSSSSSTTTTTTTPQLHFPSTVRPRLPTIIRMGGGPRTYPGGVSKWQWKRMQAKKAKQLLKARLCRERQIYEMRKRAELRAAVSELERPWEVVERAPALFSVRADEQVKVLADRFQKPGGFDLWSEKDGPQLFETPDELPSARFFPKGVVHSVRPYRRIGADELLEDGDDGDKGCSSSDSRFLPEGVDDGECSSATFSSGGRNGVSVNGGLMKNGRNGRRFLSEVVDNAGISSSPLDYGRNGVNAEGRMRKNGNGRRFMSKGVDDGSDNEDSSSSPLSYGRNGGNYDDRMRRNVNGRRSLSKDVDDESDGGERSSYPLSSERSGRNVDGRMRKNGNGRRFMSKNANRSNGLYSERVGSSMKQGGSNSGVSRSDVKYSRGTSRYASPRVRDADSEVYDMDLQQDGSYRFRNKSEQSDSKNY